MAKKTNLKELWVPLLIFFLFSGGVFAIRFLGPDKAQGRWTAAILALLVGGAVSTLTWIIKTARDHAIVQSQSDLKDARDLIIRQSRSDLWRIAEGITDRHLRSVKDFFFDESRIALQSMATGREYDVEDALIKWTEIVKGIDATKYRQIFAVCGKKDYGHDDVKTYYEANYAAARKGLDVKRIFILPKEAKKFPRDEANIIQRHLEVGKELEGKPGSVQARVVTWDASERTRQKFQIPEGYGFIILGDCVGVHWGFQSSTIARLLRGHIAVALFRGIFDRLYVRAVPTESIIRGYLP